MKYIITTLTVIWFISCAVGSQDTYNSTSTHVTPKPTYPSEPDYDAGIDDYDCTTVTDIVDDCNVVVVYCDGGPEIMNVYCPPNTSMPSWTWVPDPPPPWSSK